MPYLFKVGPWSACLYSAQKTCQRAVMPLLNVPNIKLPVKAYIQRPYSVVDARTANNKLLQRALGTHRDFKTALNIF